MRKPIALFASLILALHLSACTSSDSKEDEMSEDGAVAESTEGTDADLANLDAPPAEGDGAVASTDGSNEGFLDEQLPEDALGESKTASTETPPPSDIASDTTTPPADASSTPEAAPIDTPADTSVAAVDTGSTPTDTSSSFTDTSTGVTATTSTEPGVTESKPKATASLKKIESAPITREGVLLNAVYVARSGDNYKKISKLLYGNEDKVKELKKVNPSVKPRVGDKIYYNSPVRPADDTKMLTYYEDAGLVPDVYIAKEGDDLKKVSKELLGHKDAWKEVWATNMIESKDILEAGTELRYWKSAPAPVADVAATPTPDMPKTDVAMNTPPPDMAMTPPPVEAQPPPMPDAPPAVPPPAEMAPPPPPPVAEMAPPPPPPPMETAPEVPPPPPAEALNPPPPPPVAKKAPPAGDMGTGGMDNDMMMSLAGAGIIAAGLAAVIIIRKRRQNRDMAQAFNDTQVGT